MDETLLSLLWSNARYDGDEHSFRLSTDSDEEILATIRIIDPVSTFDYGTIVRWKDADGTKRTETVVGFKESSDSDAFGNDTKMLVVEDTAGNVFEIPLNELSVI